MLAWRVYLFTEFQEQLLDKQTCRLPAAAEEDGNPVVDDDGKRGAEHGIGMSVGSVAAGENIRQAALDNHAGKLALSKSGKLPCEPLPSSNDGTHEVLDALALYRHRVFQPEQRVITGWKRAANDFYSGRIECVRLLFPRVDYYNGSRLH